MSQVSPGYFDDREKVFNANDTDFVTQYNTLSHDRWRIDIKSVQVKLNYLGLCLNGIVCIITASIEPFVELLDLTSDGS